MAGPTFNSTNATGDKYLTTPVTSGAITVPSVNAGDTIVVFVNNITHANPTLTPTSVVDSLQGALTPAGVITVAFQDSTACYVLQNASAGTHTITFNYATAVEFWIIWGTFSNPGGSFVDQSNAVFQSSTTTLGAPITNTFSNDTVISMMSGGQAPSGQTGTQFFTGGSIGIGAVAQWQTQAGSGIITPSFSLSPASYGNFITLSLQNSGGSGLSWIRA